MNFYPFHIGDYASATAHLTMIEDAAYRRLLDLYYTREMPLPADLRQVWRLVRAQSKDERQAVEDVLREFFSETPQGWRHGRCDAEIARANEKKAKAAQSAAKRWSNAPAMRTQENEDANAHANAHANASADAMRTHMPTQCEGNAPNPNPNPNPNPKGKRQPQGADAPPFVLPDWVNPDDWHAFEAMRKQLRKPLTARARELVIRELDRLRGQGHAPGPVLQQSIRKAWQDVYPLKADQLALGQTPAQAPKWAQGGV